MSSETNTTPSVVREPFDALSFGTKRSQVQILSPRLSRKRNDENALQSGSSKAKTSVPPNHSPAQAPNRKAEIEQFARDPHNIVNVCSWCALSVTNQFGGELWGYWCSDNPQAIVGKSVGAHDFAIVDGRYLVDAWASEIEGLPLPVVFDLQNKEDAAIVLEWYGPRTNWMPNSSLTDPQLAAARGGNT